MRRAAARVNVQMRRLRRRSDGRIDVPRHRRCRANRRSGARQRARSPKGAASARQRVPGVMPCNKCTANASRGSMTRGQGLRDASARQRVPSEVRRNECVAKPVGCTIHTRGVNAEREAHRSDVRGRIRKDRRAILWANVPKHALTDRSRQRLWVARVARSEWGRGNRPSAHDARRDLPRVCTSVEHERERTRSRRGEQLPAATTRRARR